MTDVERDLLNAALEYLGPELVDAIQDCGFTQTGPKDKFYPILCEQHGVDGEELRMLLEPAKARDIRPIVLELAAILLDRFRKEARE